MQPAPPSLNRVALALQDAAAGLTNGLENAFLFCFGNAIQALNAIAFLVGLLAPLYVGALWGGFLPALEQRHALTHPAAWARHPSGLAALGVWFLALVWQHFSRKYSIEVGAMRKSVYRELMALCQGAGLQQSPEADIRCALWLVPEGGISKNPGTGQYEVPSRLVQWTDYVPAQSRYRRDGHTHYRVNGAAGRTFRVYRGHADRVYVGLLGKTLIAGMEQRRSLASRDALPAGAPLVGHLVRELNFRRRHARSVTSDRRSFLAIALIEEGSQKPLGVVYFDSREPACFSDAVEDKIFQGLPRLLDAINARG